MQTFANSDALPSPNFNCFSVVSPLVPVLWARPTCLSSKGPKPHHLWCSLAKWECQQKLNMLTSKLISFAWSSLGTSLGAWNVSSYLFETTQRPFQHCSFPENVDLIWFQKDVDLLWFAQIYYECRSLAQFCADAFLGSLQHKDIGIGKVMRVAGGNQNY